jgi:ribosomal protein S18 acetylase RimI-like enzyme
MNRGDLALLGCLGDRIAGTIRYSVDAADARMGHIKRLAVLPEYRGKGFGRELLVQAEDRLRSLGATVIELSVAAPLEPIQEFYKRAGYTPFEKRRVPTLPFEIMFMRKQVTPLTPGGSQ